MRNPKVTPRSYQIECLDAITKTVESGTKRALVVMASGLGKTLTSAFAIERFFTGRDFGRILVLCHSEAILIQSKDKFKGYFGEEYSYGMFTGHGRTARRTDFLFATFQTMKDHRKKFAKDEFNYIVVDEAHHSHAGTYFPTIKYFEPEFLLGLTATPDRLDGQNIEEIYGASVYELGFVEAVKHNLIAECDYRLVLDDLSQERLDKYIASDEKVSIKQLNRTLFLEKRDEEIVRLIGEYSAEVVNPKIMIFCRTIEHARKIAGLMGSKAVLVHRKNGESTNSCALESFKNGEVNMIISVDMLNEGVDVPDANVVVFLRNTVSPAVFYQQLGRGTRLVEGKDKVLILDFVNNCDRIRMILELKQEIDDFGLYSRHSDEGNHVDSNVNANGRFVLNIATPEFHERMVDIIEVLKKVKTQRSWSREDLLEALKCKAVLLGRTPTQKDMDNDPEMPYSRYYNYKFGTYNDAIRLAGLRVNWKSARGISDQRLLQCLKQLSDQIGHRPTIAEINESSITPSINTYVRRFGSLDDAMELAGVMYDKKGYTDDRLLDLLKDKIRILGRMPTAKEINEDEQMPHCDTYLKRFGGLKQAQELTKTETEDNAISQEHRNQLILNIQNLARQLGRTPTKKDIGPENGTDYFSRYIKVFGGWNAALTAAGLDLNVKLYDDCQLLELLITKTQAIGHFPTSKELLADPAMPTPSTIYSHFGSLKTAKRLVYTSINN